MAKPLAVQRLDTWREVASRVYSGSLAGPRACRQGFVLTHAQALGDGLGANELRRLTRRGEWSSPRRAVVSPLPESGPDPYGKVEVIGATAVALVRREAVMSHECAALARGLDVYRRPKRPTLSTRFRAQACNTSGAVVKAAWLSEDDVSGWFGVPTTTCARTVVDLARTTDRGGIVAVESALRFELVTQDELLDVIRRCPHSHGNVAARRIVDLAGTFSESPLESLVRLFLADNNVPLPMQQRWLSTHLGWFRVDGLWPDLGVVLEVDGLQKYAQRDEDHDNPLVTEKLRQEALERVGYTVVRVTWDDIQRQPTATLARIRAALR